MKHCRKWLAIIAMVAVVLTLPTAALYADDGTWTSSLQVQNLGTVNATIQIDYYDQAGNLISAATQIFSNVAPGASINVYHGTLAALPDGFIGSVVVSSSQPIVAIGNEIVEYGATSGNSSYSGVSAPGDVVYAPLVMRNYGGSQWSTQLAVQNAGAASTTVTIEYYDSTGSPVSGATENQAIAGNGSAVFSQWDNAGLSDGFIGSAKISAASASDTIAVVVNEIAGTRLVTYNGFYGGSTDLYLPLVMLHYGGSDWVTSFQVMNLGSSAANVTIEYYAQGATTPAKTVNYNGTANPLIPSMAAINRYQPGVDTDLGAGFIGSVKVICNNGQPLVAIGNESTLGAGKSSSTSYNGYGGGSTTTVNLPLIMLNYGASNWVTSFQVMNVGSADANVTIEYYAQGASTPTKTVNYDGVSNPLIAPMNAINRYQPGVDSDLGAGFIGSVKVISNNGQPLVAIGNESALNRAGDVSTTYGGLW